MGNCARRLADRPPEQMTMSGAGASATPSDRSGAGCSVEQKSEYFSPRVDKMMRGKSQFSSDVEHEIAHSREHWSEVPGLSKLSEDNEHEEEEVNLENREVFVELLNNPQWKHHEFGHFFYDSSRARKLGRRIAEGGQAEIFEVIDNDGQVNSQFLLKVFKRGSRLSDLQKQWPHGILRRDVLAPCMVMGGVMLDDGRFGFLMIRCWGDLRKLIDQAMQEKNNQGPPFPYKWNGETLCAKDIMRVIAMQMDKLHKDGIIHRDLKAANILLHVSDEGVCPLIADFECSIGVVGSGFWRAPEVLLALKNRSEIDFSEKVDVYSYGMTFFEVVTGCLPFEGGLEECRASPDLVIAGRRPKLPSDLDVPLKDLIERCWNPIPNERPSFEEIYNVLCTLCGVPL